MLLHLHPLQLLKSDISYTGAEIGTYYYEDEDCFVTLKDGLILILLSQNACTAFDAHNSMVKEHLPKRITIKELSHHVFHGESSFGSMEHGIVL